MSGGRRDAPSPAANGGEYLLSLLQQRHTPQHPPQHPPQHIQQQLLSIDPAVAAVGPSASYFPTSPSPWTDVPAVTATNSHIWANNPPPNATQWSSSSFPVNNHTTSNDHGQSQQRWFSGLDIGRSNPDFIGGHYGVHNNKQEPSRSQQKLDFGPLNGNLGLNQAANERQFGGASNNLDSDYRQFGGGSNNFDSNHRFVNASYERDNMRGKQQQQYIGTNFTATTSGNYGVHNNKQEPSQLQKLNFGSLSGNFLSNQAAKERESGGISNNFDRFVNAGHEHDNMRGKQQQHIGNYRSTMPSSETGMLLQHPGFSRQIEEDNNGRRLYSEDVILQQRLGASRQLDKPCLPAPSTLQSTFGQDIEESLVNTQLDEQDDDLNVENFGRQIVESLLLDGEADIKKDKKNYRDKDMRSDKRGQHLLGHGQRFKNSRRPCRRDIFTLSPPFLALYKTLIPLEEEKAKQMQLFTRLEKLVANEWPEARLYIYGSCASSFGVSKSDIDVCLSFRGKDINKSEILLRLADILQSDNLQNVQALTRARVPIVKLMDPETGISCDICINNILAVVNTKLLRDYAQIDGRLRQLAFIVKHWAKIRGVNETYQGTLSSYAYVLMCIHFLQQRRPAILPCLQMMEPTFTEIVDDLRCAFYDRVERLSNYGSHNMESIAELVWGFFTYWAYRHDYTRDVVSVRTGGIISKRDKDWTRRIGNDRHLICIEDPFEITHDLGRVVDKFSIKVLREEFERAAEILQFDPNPCVTLFEPYVPTC